MRSLLIIPLVVLLAGCANKQSGPLQAEYQRTIPKCSEQRDCELKWAAARSWVLGNAGLKIQNYSGDFIETYNPPPNSPLLAARILKEPAVAGGYEIKVELWCNNVFGCVPAIGPAKVDFNRKVGSAGIPANNGASSTQGYSAPAAPVQTIAARSMNKTE